MIYYAVYYSAKNSKRVKNYAGEDKIDYICQAMNDIGEDVILISNAKTTQRKFARSESIQLSEHTKLLYFSSLPQINSAMATHVAQRDSRRMKKGIDFCVFFMV